MSHPQEADLEALLQALVLDAIVREPGNRRLRPTPESLAGAGQHNLSTQLGPLDPLGILHDGRGYDELVGNSVLMEDGRMRIRVIDVDTLIGIKSSTGRDKDRLLVPILIALRRETGEREGGQHAR